MFPLTAGGEPLVLLPQRAALLPDSRTLLVADVHLGKAVSFRRLGVPVPRGTTTETLDRLAALVAAHRVRQVVVLGDFLHGAASHAPATLAALARFRSAHADVAMTVVRGNHDDRAGDPPASLDIEVVDEPHPLGGLALCHHPQRVAGRFALAGHLHPCIGVGGRAFDRLRLPCFHVDDGLAILPAFGAFTGMHPVRRRAGDRVFAIADDQVMELVAPAVAA